MIEFRMPALGADMEAGTLVEWLKKPGETVTRGDIIAVVDTDKGAIEIEAFDTGVFDRPMVEPGQKVPVGTVLALLRAEGEAPAAAAAVAPPSAPRLRVSPAARAAAAARHVDLGSVEGRGPGGAIRVEDVERAAARRRTTPAPADQGAAMRTAIGAAMSRAKREIPHLYLSTTIDLTPAVTWLAAENQRRPVTERLLPAVLFLKAVARACVEVPSLNGHWIDHAFAAGRGVHVGCAIAIRGGGLVAPAIHDVAAKPLGTIATDLADLVLRARTGGLRSSELSDGTITVTNLGELGVESGYAVIYPPQVAIVAFGRIVERPWIVNGQVAPRTVVSASVSADHRATDGREAGRFLAAVDRALQLPEAL
jgi:pyruvate dehydrogenase E2 component (dihydrolipoamide acetyltransferase)